MNTPTKKPESPALQTAADDPLIPVLTERLGLPPLEFDTTLPLIETTRPIPEPGHEGLAALASPPPAPPASAPQPASIPAPAAHALAPEPVQVLGTTGGGPLLASHPGTDGRQWARIEVELRTAILREITDRLPREVEDIVRDRMATTIDRMIAGLAAEARDSIAARLPEIVERAVGAALERLRNSNRGTS